MYKESRTTSRDIELLDRPVFCAICIKRLEPGMESFCAAVASSRFGEETFSPCEFAVVTPRSLRMN